MGIEYLDDNSKIEYIDEPKKVSPVQYIKDTAQKVKKAVVDYVSDPVKVASTPTSLASLPGMAVNKISSMVDPSIEKFRSETVPNFVEKHGIFNTVNEQGKSSPTPASATAAVSKYAIPTVKEAAIATAGESLLKPAFDFIAGKLSPKYAASKAAEETIAQETKSLANIQKNALEQPSFKSTEILSKANKAVADKQAQIWKPAWKFADGTVKETGLTGHQMFSPNVPGRESGFIDLDGKFLTIKDLQGKFERNEPVGKFLSTANTLPNVRREIIKQEMDHFTKKTVGDTKLPEALESNTPILQSSNKPSFMKSLATQVLPEETALRKQGPTGSLLADNILNYSRDSQVMAGKAHEKVLPDLLKLPEEIRNKIPDYLEPRVGQERPVLAGEAKRVAEKVRKHLKAWGRFLENQDIEVVRNGKVSKFYAKDEFFPRTIDSEALIKDPELQNDEILNLLTEGQVKTVEEGKQVLEAALATKSSIFSPDDFTNMFGTRKVSTIERPRVYTFKHVTNDPIENLVGYFNNVSRRVNEIKYFGQKSEFLHADLAKMASEGGNAKFAQEITNRVLRQQLQDPSVNYLVRQLRSFQGLTKLGLSAIPNVQQGPVDSYIRSGSLSAVKEGYIHSFTKDGISFARRAGVVENAEVDKYMEMISGLTGKEDASTLEKITTEFLKKTGFKKSEELNRIQAANIGKSYIQELAKNYLEKPKAFYKEELENYGVNVENLLKRKYVSENELLKGANTFVGETQFGNRPLGQPHIFTSSPLGQIAGQFSSFPIQQGRLIASSMAKRPLSTPARVVGTAVGVGGPLGMVGNMARGKAPIEKADNPRLTMANYVLDSVLNSGALGKAGNIATAGKYGAEGVAGQMVGPTIMEAAKLGANAYQAAHGKAKALKKQIIQNIPVIGRGISNVLLPTKKK